MHSWKRPLIAAALLLLVGLTLAPRTSWTLDSVAYDLVAATPDRPVRVNAGVPLSLVLTSRSDEATVAKLVIDVSLDGKPEGADVAGASKGCAVDDTHVVCTVRLKPRGEASISVIGRGLEKGQLLFNVTEGFAGEKFGTAAVDIVPATTGARGGGGRR